ncbi:NAD(P)-dependent oxidoreductase [Streptomyces sp. G5(2025)]|uniref:NAD(P)-dependent oxidoreductase n=1 Tax=Streptomyces sp. G5(2025) TaxID=3406628 RepID=UPI003C27FD4D
MRITVFGAAGNAGSRVVAEALARGHEVTAVVRDPARHAEPHRGATHRSGDAGDPDHVAELAAGQDVVVDATRPAPGREADHAAVIRSLLTGLARTPGVRLLVIGGASSLTVPGTDGTLAIDDPRYIPEAWRPIAEASTAQYEALRTADTPVDWTYLSPPALFEPGTRTGTFRLGKDELLVAPDGTSSLSMEDAAVALMDEAENPRHHRGRFTAGY